MGAIAGPVLGGVASGVVGGYFADRAASRMSRAQRQANALNQRMYDEARDYADPFISGGQDAFSQLMASYGVGGQPMDLQGFYGSPDYQFALQQGTQALDRSAAARGRLYSGAQMNAVQGFGQGLASQYLNNYRSGLQGLTGTGLNALNSLSGSRAQFAQQGAQGLQNLGNISGARQLGYGNILGNAVGYGVNALMSGGGQSSYGGGSFGLTGADYAGPWGG